MIPTERFRLDSSDAQRQQATLLDTSGAKVGSVDGAVLEAQFELADGGYLLVSSDDDAFEACLHLTLLDAKLARSDGMQLGLPYRTGSYRHRETGPGERLRFSFFAEEIWQLDIAAQPRLRFAHPFAPARYTSPFLAGHRLRLLRR
jgi:hypothetical protein